jgi:mannosyl-glycoprotein endo-beta-N-acetylglucosaminidase
MGRVPGVNSAEIETQANTTLPLTPYYAELFADIAKERGFDGYLLNIEIGLGRGAEQARALAAWITILQSELVRKVGPHAQTIWYDSVTIRGELKWQNRLNSANLLFFLNSSGRFTNYWVRPALVSAYDTNMNDCSVVVQRRTSEADRILQQDRPQPHRSNSG